MFNKIYGFLVEQKLHQLDLFNYLEVAEKYGKIHYTTDDIFSQLNGTFFIKETEKDEPLFVSSKDNDGNESCVVFYGNLFIIFSMNKELNDKIVQIYMKRPTDEWEIRRINNGNDNRLDLLNPTNVKVEVYVNYDVSVCKLSHRLGRCGGEEYHSGKWNTEFHRAINSFIKKVESYTEINQIKQAYNGK